MKKWIKRTVIAMLAIVVIGLLIPQNLKMPVVGAGWDSYNHETFGILGGDLPECIGG